MVRTWSLLLGVGLVFLGLAGLGSTGTGPGTGSWVPWFDFVGAFLSLVVAGSAKSGTLDAERVAGPRMISIGLFVIWIAALIIGNVPTSLAWWNFTFGLAYGLVAMTAGGTRRTIAPRTRDEAERMTEIERERERERQQRPPRRMA